MSNKLTDTETKRGIIAYIVMFLLAFCVFFSFKPAWEAFLSVLIVFGATFGVVFLVVAIIKMAHWVERG